MRKVIDDYKKANKDWLDFTKIDAADKEIEIFGKIHQASDTISMFNQKKLIIIENIFSVSQETQKEILEFLKKRHLERNRDITIIFWVEEVATKNDLFRFLKTKAKSQEFEPLKGPQLKNWIKNYVSQQKGNIEAKAIDRLIEYVGNDLWRMSNEINKLILFKMGDQISVEDVELLVKPEIDLNIFEMVDALGQKNKSKVLKIFNQFLEKREDEGYLLSMFIYQIRNLIKVKAGGRLVMHPFVAKKSRQQARNFSFEDLKKIYHQLLTIDFEIKTGKTDPKTAIELFVVGL